MDRFIDAIGVNSNFNMKSLKSNMDRFIDTTAILNDFSEKFKIQYG